MPPAACDSRSSLNDESSLSESLAAIVTAALLLNMAVMFLLPEAIIPT